MARASHHRRQRLLELLDAALTRDPESRRCFLAGACEDDAERREVEALLDTADAPPFMEQPAFSVHRPDAALGRRIGPYTLVRLLGRGGMGTVYLAEREDFEKRVALKLVRRGLDADAAVVRRFHTERQILARLEHPYVARLLDGGTTEDRLPYLVMEHVEGEPLDRYCRRLPLRERLAIFVKICAAVQFAHRNLVIHRDLKPSNVLVTAAGEPRLLDFGIAKLLDADATATGRGPMTPRYASPEQVRGEPVTTASDVYALGVLLYEVLTGRDPYAAAGGGAISRAILEVEPARPSTAVRGLGDGGRRRRELAGDLDSIVLKAMRKEPDERYGSAERLADDLGRYLAGLPVAARAGTWLYRAGKLVRRHRLRLAAAAVFLVLLGASAVATLEGARERRRADRAVEEAAVLSDFLTDLFRQSEPDRARGEPLTARELLDRGRRMASAELEDEPELRATLLEVLGRVYHSLGDAAAARPLLEEALRLRRRVLGADHPLVADAQFALALVLGELGESRRVEPLMREAVAIQRRHYRGGHLNLARGLSNLATLYYDRGAYARAEALLRDAMAMKRRLGADQEDLLTTLNNLAAALLAQREDDAEAAAIYRRVLAARQRLHGPRHTAVAGSLNNLGKVLFVRGEHREAEAVYRQALAIRRELLGAAHPRVATSLNNLARTLAARGAHREAETLYGEALAILRARLGDGHPAVANVEKNLAALLVDAGRAAAAEPLARRAVATLTAALPAGHWRRADAESVLGGCLASLGRREEAEKLLVESHAVLARTRGDRSIYTRAAKQRLLDLRQ